MSSQDSSSSQNASLEPQLPRCGMNDLPTEIKARIVELCAQQDERFRVEIAKLPFGQMLEEGKVTQGHSLRALFEVSKEFCALAAPHIFKVLKATKINVIFKCGIAPYDVKLSCFREVHFNSLNHTELLDIVGVVPRLRNITELVFHGQVLELLWPYGDFSLDPVECDEITARYTATALRGLTHVRVLRLTGVGFLSLTPFVQTFDNLRVLHLTLYLHIPSHQSSAGFAHALSAAHNLEELQITGTGDYDPRTSFPDLATVQLFAPPPLHQLSLGANYLYPSFASFAAVFAATLKQVSVTSAYGYPLAGSPAQPDFSSHIFPLVTTFSLSGLAAATSQTLASLAPKAFPALSTLELNIDVASYQIALSPFSSFPALRTLRLLNLEDLHPAHFDAVRHFCFENDLNLESEAGGPSSLAMPLSPPLIRVPAYDGPGHLAFEAAGVRTTLMHLLEQVDEAEIKGDEHAVRKVKTALAGLEKQRVFEKVWKAV
ncbi:hypothetical protein JCM6882_001493 [Rhodosporidiobolus microsporus]